MTFPRKLLRLFCHLLAALAALLPMSALQAQNTGLKTYTLEVGDFQHLIVEDSFNVEYHASADSAGLAVFVAEPGVADKIMFDHSTKGRLNIIKALHEMGEMAQDLPTIHVYSHFLTEVKNSGDSTVRVMTLKPTAEFKASVIGNGRLTVNNIEVSKFSGAIKTGNGTLTVSGTAHSAVLSNTGTGTIQADELRTEKASCRFFGNGTTGCWPLNELTVKGTGGKLFYRGTPERIRSFAIGVKILSIETGSEFK